MAATSTMILAYTLRSEIRIALFTLVLASPLPIITTKIQKSFICLVVTERITQEMRAL